MELKNQDWWPWLRSFVEWSVRDKFYGKLTLHFENGRVVHLRREQTLKPPGKK